MISSSQSRKNGRSSGNPSPSFASPLPRPEFYDQFDPPLSTKREKMRSTPTLRPTGPRLARTAPALGRVVPRRFALQKPVLISFSNPPTREDSMIVDSLVYNPQLNETYFEQCFEIESRIGEGSFGEVFAVLSRENSRRYAVKRSLEPFRNSIDRQLKLREVQKHELLPPHVNLVRFEKAWEERGRLYIQTELCETSLLEYAMRNHFLPEAEIWNFFLDLLMAVDHLHSHDLIHVDIKPDNIFLTKDKICKLGDFGLIFDLSTDRLETAEEGDSKYLAPEVLNAPPTKAADIFSLGITILEIASDLDLPSRGESWHLLRSGQIPQQYLENLAMSVPLRGLVLWMMDPDPAMRPTTRQLLEHPAVASRLGARRRFLFMIRIRSRSREIVLWVWTVIASFIALFSLSCIAHRNLSTPYRCPAPRFYAGSITPEYDSNGLPRFDGFNDDADPSYTYGGPMRRSLASSHHELRSLCPSQLRSAGDSPLNAVYPCPRHKLDFDNIDDSSSSNEPSPRKQPRWAPKPVALSRFDESTAWDEDDDDAFAPPSLDESPSTPPSSNKRLTMSCPPRAPLRSRLTPMRKIQLDFGRGVPLPDPDGDSGSPPPLRRRAMPRKDSRTVDERCSSANDM